MLICTNMASLIIIIMIMAKTNPVGGAEGAMTLRRGIN